MRSYHRLNNLVGWLVFAIATATYLLTLEPTASFWDCGEFIACSYKLLVPHPPGAPTFLLLGRLFSLLSFGDVTKVSVLVNALSALSSSFTVLFLFWIITMLAKKLVLHRPGMHDDRNLEPTQGQTLLILGAGAVGALAYAFSDSFWFNAVEAEVYAMSSLCTAVVVWLMLKWENRADEPDSDRWLVLIAYVIGLSIGVHLLNLLTIPALGFIYYYRRTQNPTTTGGILTLAVSSVIVGLILAGIIPGLPTLAGAFEVFFVNTVGLPFSSGLLIFLVLFVGLIWLGFRQSFQRRSRLLNTVMLSFVFILIGYSSYLIVPIRSSFNPTINENAPNDVLSFVSYLKREQYGDRPLLYGPQFNARPIRQDEGAPRYVRQGDKYVVAEYRPELVYDPADKMLLPRLYSSDPLHIYNYKKWVDIQEDAKPTMGQNLSFLTRYQMGHMFWRYFLWNYVGRESDIQQAGVLWPGAQNTGLPERVATSEARNNFFALPLILGLAGLIYQVRRDGRNAFIVGLLFVFTGLAIVIYLNQPPIEPRERDYTFAGATFAFAIWIGLGVLALADLLKSVVKADTVRAGLVSALSLVAVPGLMAAQGWDDHDRSNRYNSVDSAKNLLNSCAPNAILFTNGDNDTFPLWYAQEVEGVRTDVRVAVLSYLNTDWYIDQMKRRAYKSEPLPVSMEHDTYKQGTNDYLPYAENPAVQEVNVQEFMQLVNQNSPLLQVSYGEGGPTLLSYPTRKFYLPVDTAAVAKMGIIPAERRGQLVPRMEWELGKSAIEKKSLLILDILATNNWKRPVYFSSTVDSRDFMGLQPYFQLEGMAYRILPAKDPNYEPRGEEGYVAQQLMYDKLMNQFAYRGLDNPSIYYDENHLRFPANYRDKFARLANSYLASGDKARAKQVMDKCFALMPDKSVPYDYYVPQFIPALVAVGDKARANEIMDTMTGRAERALAYYSTHNSSLFDQEYQTYLLALNSIGRAAEQIGDQQRAAKAVSLLQRYMQQ
ncbi:glycosyltransferase family 117 protein [Hymenobacter weizhouensis]|uniref:glycosyltransferase family 117 protein n=1 Tax=Hymenobacter sp. YIM 151500-1 TaxID=2987689 RepID=UPI002227A9B2|nr:DUF2723 domain-containing protein [Hymenobacter sp. YIM 151500-1]UYZ63066.1 DUF2723 domain-containing protein [Hymenobacter sp. YIM 151500-1]